MSAQTETTRGEIRRYLHAMLSDKVDVKGRVFVNRAKSPIFVEELPAINITFSDEENKVIDGSEFFPKWYQRSAAVIVTVAVEEIVGSGDQVNESQRGADFLDYLAEQVEYAIGDDWNLSKRNAGYNPDMPEEGGLTFGHQITGSSLYEVEVEGERKILAADIRITYPYQKKARPTKRLQDFETYRAGIVRVGAISETVDPVLMSAEGDLQ